MSEISFELFNAVAQQGGSLKLAVAGHFFQLFFQVRDHLLDLFFWQTRERGVGVHPQLLVLALCQLLHLSASLPSKAGRDAQAVEILCLSLTFFCSVGGCQYRLLQFKRPSFDHLPRPPSPGRRPPAPKWKAAVPPAPPAGTSAEVQR